MNCSLTSFVGSFDEKHHRLYIIALENGFGGGAVGHMQVTWGGGSDSAFASELMVHADFRKKGIATAILELAAKFCKKQNFRSLGLTASKKVEGLIAFYRKRGFLVGYDYPDGDDVLMVMSLE